MRSTANLSTAKTACCAVLGCMALSSAAAAVGAPQVELLVPQGIIGDGATSVVIEIKHAATTARIEELGASGGQLGEARPVDAGFVVSYVPPAVAADTAVTLHVVLSEAGKQFSASRTLNVRRPPDPGVPFASHGPLDLRINPLPLVLRPGASAQLSVRAPADGSSPRVFVSLGTVSPWKATADGRLTATYTAPTKAFPQAAILAVVAQAHIETLDWAVLPLFGKGFVRTTTEANARVVIRVGTATYGPFRTDARGMVGVPVLAPPGVSTGTTTATDDLGNTKNVRVDLTAPHFNRLLTACADDSNRLLIFAVERSGAPAQKAEIETHASAGSLSAVQRMAPGVFEALFEPPGSARSGDRFELSATLQGDHPSVSTCGVVVRSARVGSLYVVSREPGIAITVDETHATTPLQAPVQVAAGARRLAASLPGLAPLDAALEIQLGRRTDVVVGVEDGALRLLEVRIVNPDTPLLLIRDEQLAGVEPDQAAAGVTQPAATGSKPLGWRWVAALSAGGAGLIGIGVAGYYANEVDTQNSRARSIETELAAPSLTRARVDALAVETASVNAAGRRAQSRQRTAVGLGLGLIGVGVAFAVWELSVGVGAPEDVAPSLAVLPRVDGAEAVVQLRW